MQKQCTSMYITEYTLRAFTDEWCLAAFDRCEDLGLTQIKPGTTTSDVECGNKIQGALIAGIVVCIVVVVAVTLVILLKIGHKIGRCAGKCFILI